MSGSCDYTKDIMPMLGDFLRGHLSAEQQSFLCRLKDKGFDIVTRTQQKNTIRIRKAGRDYGYINSTVIRERGVFGYKFERYDHCPDKLADSIEIEFGERYGCGAKNGWICHPGHGNRKHRKFMVVTDTRLAYKILKA